MSRTGDEVAVATVAGRRSAPRPGWGGPLVTVAEPALVVVAVLAVWEVLARAGVLPGSISAPGAIVSSLASDVQTSRLWDGVLASVGAWAVGLGIVVVVGVPVGVILGSSRVLYAATRHTVEFLRMIPSIAALPLLVLVYGVGFKLTVVLVVLTALWPLLLQSMYGVHDVDPVARDTARVLRARARACLLARDHAERCALRRDRAEAVGDDRAGGGDRDVAGTSAAAGWVR